MATFHLLNFGCRASQADGAALKRKLVEAGFAEAASPKESQLAVLNTCTVTAAADAEVRQVIRRIHRENPHCRILVTGCYAQRAPEEIARLEGVAWVVGNSHKHVVAELLKKRLESRVGNSEPRATEHSGLVQIRASRSRTEFSNPASDASETPDIPEVLVGEIPAEFHFTPVFADDRTRPTLKVQDGCDARCSFCVIPLVRGPSRSLAPEKVIEQVGELERAGYREIVLSGINLGSYGRDLERRIHFLGLLERILAATTMARVRISSIEPMDVTPELIRRVAREPRLAEHFHVPLQSGCDRILRLMNRRYWTRQYAERIQAIREQVPNAAIGADVMVGFPGETDEDHAASARFIDSLPFTYLHIFPYSARPTTPAASRPDQVNGRIAHERSQEIRSIIARKRTTFLAAQVGRTLSALTLKETQEGARVALSSNYLKIALPGWELGANELVDIRIRRVHERLLYGHPQERRREFLLETAAHSARETGHAPGNPPE